MKTLLQMEIYYDTFQLLYLLVILHVKAARKRNTFLRANVKVFARKRNCNPRKRNAPDPKTC